MLCIVSQIRPSRYGYIAQRVHRQLSLDDAPPDEDKSVTLLAVGNDVSVLVTRSTLLLCRTYKRITQAMARLKKPETRPDTAELYGVLFGDRMPNKL